VRGTRKIKRAAIVECGAGVASATVTFWRCHTFKARVMPDGRDRGVVFLSTTMIYSEMFLFETAVGLLRNGCSLRSSAQLREVFHELSAPHLNPHVTKKLKSVSTPRKAVILHLSLVVKGVPLAVTQCVKCRRSDGSYMVVCFDGLQLGYRVKYKMPFKQSSDKVGAHARASLHARVIQYEWAAKALGRVFVTDPVPLTAAQKRITTVAGMCGHVMALIVLVGRINAVGAKVTFVDEVANPARKDAGLGWDPTADGGVRPELALFLRVFFRLGRAARSPALTIQEAAGDLLRRVPQRLKELVAAVVADLSEAGQPSAVAGVRNAPVKEEDGTDGEQCASDGEPEEDVGLDMEDVLDEVKVVPNEPPTLEWDDLDAMRPYAEQLSETALADTNGAGGVYRASKGILPLLPTCPSTAASRVSVLSFVRAVTVDLVTI